MAQGSSGDYFTASEFIILNLFLVKILVPRILD